MLRSLLIAIIFVSFLGTVNAQHRIRFEIVSLPSYHNTNSEIFLAGSFNGWNPLHENFRFRREGRLHFLEVELRPGIYEYKITRGSWQRVETSSDGTGISNRRLTVEKDDTIKLGIEGWQDHFGAVARRQTISPNVKVLDTAFFIPQLNRHRRVWIYLPPGYSGSKKRFPVIYMHDGQNVFNEATSFAGEWGVDECIDTLALKTKGAIVVAVDHGGNKRLNEYSPYDFNLSGNAQNYESNKGEGAAYVDFLAKTLKLYIDKNFRTCKKRKSTFIVGSSMGGLISMYALIRYPKVYGGAGVFSPAFWIAPKIFDDIKTRGHKIKSRIYFYAGILESESMVRNTYRAFNELQKISKSELFAVIRAEGLHNEQRWRMEFPLFYNWTLKN